MKCVRACKCCIFMHLNQSSRKRTVIKLVMVLNDGSKTKQNRNAM